MTIYTFDKVTELLTELGFGPIHYTKREQYLKKYRPIIHQEVHATTSFLVSPSFVERLYYYTNGITDQSMVPTCKVCDNHVKFHEREKNFRTYCSKGCIGRDPDIKAMKDARDIEYMANNGGISKRTRSPAARAKVSEKNKKHGAERREALIDSISEMEPTKLTKEEYFKLARRLTEYMYTKYKHDLDPGSLRSKAVHIDHMVSIMYGFMNHIPIYIIGDITNLRMLDGKANISKNCTNCITFDELMERYNEFYADKERPLLDETFVAESGVTHYTAKRPAAKDKGTKYTDNVGVCVHCGGEAHYIKYDGTYLCNIDARKCPAKRSVINKKQRKQKQEIAENKLKLQATVTGVTEYTPTKQWYNNGIECVYADECPSGYVEGKGKLWFNNGEIQVFEFKCPSGFNAGMLIKQK